MKKVLVIFLALIIGLSLSAQIQNKILGFTLGKTKSSEVYKRYKNDYTFSRSLDSEHYFVDNVKFAGYYWDVNFGFYNGKLYQVILTSIWGDIASMGEKLKSSLDDKYRQYLWNSEQNRILYSDNTNAVQLSIYETKIVLIYLNVPLADQKHNNEKSEL